MNSHFPLLGRVPNAFNLCSTGGTPWARWICTWIVLGIRNNAMSSEPYKKKICTWGRQAVILILTTFLLFYPVNLIFKNLYINFSYINPWNNAWKAHAINTTWLTHMPVADKIYKKWTNLRIIISLYHPYKSSQLFWHFNYKVTLPVLQYCVLCNRSFHLIHVMSLAAAEESFYNPSPLQRQKVNKKLNKITRKLRRNWGSPKFITTHIHAK